MKRGHFISASSAAGLAAFASVARAKAMTTLDVAYAGSMGSMMEGPIKSGAAALGIEMRGRAQGSDALAQLIVAGSIAADVFVPVTPHPMLTVITAGKAQVAVPIARTEMVIAYSPKSAFAQQFADAAAGKSGAKTWFEILQQPGVRFGRTDPATDPQGRNIIFTFQLAERLYSRRGLTENVLGTANNPAQIFSEPTVEARLQSGELDAASAYRIQPGPFNLPFIALPEEINLGNASLSESYRQASITLGTKTFHPEPLVYYAAVLSGSAQPKTANDFVQWLAGPAQAIFKQFNYDAPTGAASLHA